MLMVGPGPSSSHTIGPYRIVKDYLGRIAMKKPIRFEVTLFGSLALTGRGHATDKILKESFLPYPTEIIFCPKLEGLAHPNTMDIKAFFHGGTSETKRYLSIGGGSFCLENEELSEAEVYPFHTLNEALAYMEREHIADFYSLIEKLEDDDILDYAKEMLNATFHTLKSSLSYVGTLPGPLHLKAVSNDILKKAKLCLSRTERRLLLLTAYAYSVSEANARGEMIVTAPTCGSSGVVPSVLFYEYHNCHRSLDEIAKAYLVGAFFCDFIKENASFSGALLGCQAEIGSAASFAAASLSYLHHLSNHQIEYAAEVGMEHFLGLTCDPVDGYVQIPCIERNGIAAIHAYSAYLYAKNISPYRENKVSFDKVVQAMKETGKELPSDLKETSLGGLAKVLHC